MKLFFGNRMVLAYWLILFAALIALDRTVAYFFVEELADLRDLEKNATSSKEVVFLGSSTMFYAMDTDQIKNGPFGDNFTLLGIPSGSPLEFRAVYQRYLADKKKLFIVITESDLNDNNVSTSMVAIVPFFDVLRLLPSSGIKWEVAKKIFSEYALSVIRFFLSISGRGNEIAVVIRNRISFLMNETSQREEGVTAFRPAENQINDQSISDYGKNRMARVIAKEKYSSINPHIFRGYKLKALEALLDQLSLSRTESHVIFLPVSPLYRSRIRINAKGEKFEDVVEELETRFPRIRFLNFSTENTLQNDSLYFDPIHLNKRGRALTTRIMIQELFQ